MKKKAFNVIITVLLVTVILLSLSGCGFVTRGGKVYSDARNSVVLIYAENELFSGTGSGFAIGEPGKPVQYIVTNYHCVFDTEEYLEFEDGSIMFNPFYDEKMSVRVYFSAAANRFMDVEIYRHNKEKDIAILRLPEPTTEREAMVLSPMNKTDVDGQFWAYGYPWTAAVGGQDYMKYDQSDIAATTGGIQKATRVTNSQVREADAYLLDLEIRQGNSGGPLVNAKGEVVGINTFAYDDGNARVSFAIAIDELMRMIDRNNIHYTVAGDINVTNVIILAVAAVVVLLIAVVLIIVLGKKKKPAAAAVNNASAPSSPSASVAAAPVLKSYLRALGGHFSGRSFEVGGRIIIGRDSSKCTISFPVDSAGISGIHCEVYTEGQTAYLRDLGSSYGTFLASGTKLAEKSPHRLTNGDKFYVANDDNTFEFTLM